MTPFRIYCSTCKLDTLITQPCESNKWMWTSSCPHGRAVYLQHLANQMRRIGNWTWDEGTGRG